MLETEHGTSHILSRLKSVWLLDQEGLRTIPYIPNLKKEATILYFIPGIVISVLSVLINVYLGNIDIRNIASLLYTFLFYLLLELGFIGIYLGVIFLIMLFILPGFPNKSHASPLMVYQVFAYIFTIRILYALTYIAVPIIGLPVYVYLFYILYFTIQLSFAIRTLVGKRILVSAILGFIAFYCMFLIFGIYGSVLVYIGI